MSRLGALIDRIPVARIVIGIIVIMALASLYVTSSYNDQQRRYVGCGGAEVLQTIQALQARDEASLELAASDKRLVAARYVLLLLVAHAPNAPTDVTLSQATIDYESNVQQFEVAIDAYTNAIQRAPLPDPSCLINNGRVKRSNTP